MVARSKWILSISIGVVLLFFAQTILSGYHIAPSLSGDHTSCCDNGNTADDSEKLPVNHSCHIHFHLAVGSSDLLTQLYIEPALQMLSLLNDICPDGIISEIEHPPQLS